MSVRVQYTRKTGLSNTAMEAPILLTRQGLKNAYLLDKNAELLWSGVVIQTEREVIKNAHMRLRHYVASQ